MMRQWKIFGGVGAFAALIATAAWAIPTYFPNTTVALDMSLTGCNLASSGTHYFVVTDGTDLFCDPPASVTPLTVGAPTTRTLSLATAYQATSTSKPSIVTVNLTSTATISLSGGTTNTADILIGSTNGVASGTGTVMCKHANSNTGTLTIGLNLSTIATTSCTLNLPAGWFFAVRSTSGTVTITSAFDQSLG